jgi:hypothetical protein
MNEVIFSPKQYYSLVDKLEEIINGVTLIKLKEVPETTFIDNDNLLKLLMITNRTIQRWRKSGRLPFIRIGKKLYYRLEDILNNFSIRPEMLKEYPLQNHVDHAVVGDFEGIKCKNCPLIQILNLEL